jgi:prevent-host-death family protein
MIEPPEISASDAKNGFGRILERVAREGGVTITRRHEPVAVVIPIETYRRLAAAEARSLETLSGEFDALLARMQAPGVGEAMQRAFEMMPETLGAAAVAAMDASPAGNAAPATDGPRPPAPRRRARHG